MLSWNLAATELLRHSFWAAELLTCGPQQLRCCKPATDFGLRELGKLTNIVIAEFRPLFNCGIQITF